MMKVRKPPDKHQKLKDEERSLFPTAAVLISAIGVIVTT
jgi:hypothetical protein